MALGASQERMNDCATNVYMHEHRQASVSRIRCEVTAMLVNFVGGCVIRVEPRTGQTLSKGFELTGFRRKAPAPSFRGTVGGA